MGAYMIILTLPYPPSINHYWIASGHRRFISAKGATFRAEVYKVAHGLMPTMLGNLMIEIDAYPPDKRRRDLDNILKALFDSLEHAKVYKNDNQIAKMLIVRKEVATPGRLTVRIDELREDRWIT